VGRSGDDVMETALIILGLALAFWVLWLERKLRNLADEIDTLCHALVGIAHGRLVIVKRGNKITIKPTTEV
jgi:uncharacterized protein YoxC